jgi:hypothetical protein
VLSYVVPVFGSDLPVFFSYVLASLLGLALPVVIAYVAGLLAEPGLVRAEDHCRRPSDAHGPIEQTDLNAF